MACRGRSNDLDHRPHARMLRVGPVLQRRTPGEQSRRGHVGRSGQWREAARSAARVASSAAGVGVDWCSVRRFRLGSARERARRGTGAPARTSVSVSSAAVRHGAGHAVTRVRGRRRTGAAAPGGGGRAARARPVGHHVHAPAVLGQANTLRPTFAPGTRPTQDARSASCCGGEPLTPADPYSHTQRRKPRSSDLGFRRWRCRESNPGPPLLHKGFSVRSPPCLYSDPPVMRTSRCDGPSRCLVSLPAPRPGGQVSPLADAGIRGGNSPGPTVPNGSGGQRERGPALSRDVHLIGGTYLVTTRG